MARSDRRGKGSGYEQFTLMLRPLMYSEAFRSLSSVGKALYPYVRMEWKGKDYNNNGRIRLSHRQAARLLGVSKDTATKAFHDLQKKGFLVVTRMGALGVEGIARCPCYEITELPLPTSETNRGRRLYLEWKPGKDFDVAKHSKRKGPR